MAIPEDHISAQLLSRLEGQSNKEKWENLSREYPWYPLPWLMLAETDAEKQKAALWFKNEHRIHWLLNGRDSGATPYITSSSPATIEEDLPAADPTGAVESVYLVQSRTSEISQHSTEIIENERDNLESSSTIQPAVDALTEKAGEDALDIPLDEEEIKEELESPFEVEDEDKIEVKDKVGDEVKLEEETASLEPTVAEPLEEPQPEIASEDPAKNEQPASDISMITKPAPEEKLVFEPLYTTDYFASQGIKVDPNAIPKTKLDRQVKSFTQWLKTMKRVGPETSSAADPLVDAQASASVQEKDVITEAMVAVLEKQGKYQKAIDTLGKLILLHPEKSAFFAAQIENLKAKQ